MIQIIPVKGIPLIKEGDNLGKIISEKILENNITLSNGDIIVIAHKIVSRCEGRIVNLANVTPSKFALRIAEYTGKDPRKIEMILQEANAIIRMSTRVIITETRLGFICANSGVDSSNSGKDAVTLLPINPDKSAEKIRREIKKILNVDIGVIISDTHGRVLRKGAVGVAIGISGLPAFSDYRGKKDLFGYKLKSTVIGFADEVASAAQLVMGEADEGTPVVVVKGLKFRKIKSKASEIIRSRSESLFI